MSSDLQVRDNPEARQFEAIADGHVVGHLKYRQHGKRVIITRTSVDPDHRGAGIATELVRVALDDAAAKMLTLTNYCPFVADYIAAHPSYRPVVDTEHPGAALVPDRAPRAGVNEEKASTPVLDVPKIEGRRIRTPRLQLAPWTTDDAAGALRIFGDAEVARWLAPALGRITTEAEMRDLLAQWVAEDATLPAPLGRWKVDDVETGKTIGAVALLLLPPYDVDYEIGIQIAAAYWGRGVAAEAGHALAHYAFDAGVDEVFAVSRPRNRRAAAAARRMGMEWVGETDKYYDVLLDVYRLRRGDLDLPLW
ncbi:GNAT family N-acetyltransferase [Kribbella pittospori]|uniref:GNAT family N-acetyltransferase n=1 Tax=Kribbella pittospori TaxID=722689 RepID=A0A4R0K901_9ACTN|nr:GNAT family N-acetyltransferase [Kribbella pittospori]TCC54408.1 GNAT family N-acetyltransferase [Kribbella pittospori]